MPRSGPVGAVLSMLRAPASPAVDGSHEAVGALPQYGTTDLSRGCLLPGPTDRAMSPENVLPSS